MAFAESLRKGDFHGGSRPSSETIAKILRTCAQIMVSRGFADPRKSDPAQTQLDKSLSDRLKVWHEEDPAPLPQQALPGRTVRWIGSNYLASAIARIRITGDLVVLAFFFLLRVGEYTKSYRTTRTVPLRQQDVTLWRNNIRLANSAPLDELLLADAVTINLANQKNGHKDAVLHHWSTGDNAFDPVRSAARLIHATHGMGPATQIGSFRNAAGRVQQVSAGDIRSAVTLGAAATNLVNEGYSMDRIGSHSLRAGGATHLKIAGYDDSTIMKMGRWSSNTYLRYIQTQVGEFSRGIAAAMSRPIQFHQVGGRA